MPIDKKQTIGEVVRQNFRTAPLFESKGIDFCCGGNISIEDACKQVQLNADELIDELEKTLKVKDSESDYLDSLSLTELCEYIIGRHHQFIRKQVPVIQEKLEKLCRVHGENHAELFEISQEFEQAAQNLALHLVKEEEHYFPYIKWLETPTETKPTCEVSINQLREEHQAEGDRFFRIAHLTNNYQAPADGCATYTVSFEMLREFEQDLHRHVHLENNMLFVKAAELEVPLK